MSDKSFHIEHLTEIDEEMDKWFKWKVKAKPEISESNQS